MPKIFLDSGAFTVKSTGIPVDIQAYGEFIKENLDTIEVYANLDVIGDSKAGWENQKILENMGLNPLPVFHPISDKISDLHRCLDNYEYFGVGGIAHGATFKRRISVLDNVWDICTDKKGMPLAKIHGFGLADIKLVNRYPWFSIDSSSWATYSRYGTMLLPKMKAGVWDYTRVPVKVFVSNNSPFKWNQNDDHVSNFSKSNKKVFDLYLEEKEVPFGVSEWDKNSDGEIEEIVIEPGVSNDNFWRDFINFCFYQDMCNAQPEWPYVWKEKQKYNVRLF